MSKKDTEGVASKSEVIENNLTDVCLPEKLAEVDRLSLELAKANRKIALAQAEKALAQNETAELGYKYVVLQLYMKYNLSSSDGLSEAGEIIRGGANKSALAK